MNGSVFIVIIFIGGVIAMRLINSYRLKVNQETAKVVMKCEGLDEAGQRIFKITGKTKGGVRVTYNVLEAMFNRTSLNADIEVAYKMTRYTWDIIPVLPVKGWM